MKIRFLVFLLLFSTQTQAFDFNLNFLDLSRLFEEKHKFSVGKAERLFALAEVLHIDSKDGVLKANYHNYDFDMLYRGKNIFIRPFDEHIYNLYIQKTYSESWHKFIGQYDSLGRTVQLLLSQYEDIAKRLDKAYESRKALQEKYQTYYADSQYLQPIEKDIRQLSQLGWQLTIVTRRFHNAIRPMLVNREMTQDRAKAHLDIIGGLDNYRQQIGFAEHYTEKAVGSAVEVTIENVSNAVYELERLKKQLNYE